MCVIVWWGVVRALSRLFVFALSGCVFVLLLSRVFPSLFACLSSTTGHFFAPPPDPHVQTFEEKELAQQPEAAAVPLLRVVVVGLPSSSPPTPTPAIASPSETLTPATTVNTSAGTHEDDGVAAASIDDESTAPQQLPEAAAGGGQGRASSLSANLNNNHSSSNDVVVKIPLESLDPEAFCLTPVSHAIENTKISCGVRWVLEV